MIEIQGNIWDFHKSPRPENFIGITTNAVLKNGARGKELVMGKGIALDAKTRYPLLPSILAYFIERDGNIPVVLEQYKLFTFPTKIHWKDKSNKQLIIHSAEVISKLLPEKDGTFYYLPRPGCGCGGLEWSEVKPLIENILHDGFVIVSTEK